MLVFVLVHIDLFPFYSSFAIILMRKRELVALLYFFWMSCYCKCSVALPQGAVGSSEACDCGNS